MIGYDDLMKMDKKILVNILMKTREELDRAKSFLIVSNIKKEMEHKENNNPKVEYIYAYEEKDGSIHFTDYHNSDAADELITTNKYQRLDWTRKEKENE